MIGKYYGLYRGYVVDNDDSAEANPYLGRVRVSVPEVYGEVDEIEKLPWAWPCLPAFSGGVYDSETGENDVSAAEDDETKFSNGMIAIPPVGSTVWVQFEQGDPQSPVYMGAWIGRASEMPTDVKSDATVAEVSYPKIFILKMPWGKDMFLRAVEDKVFELSFDDMHIQLKGESSEDAGDAEMFLWTSNTNIKIASTEGNVDIYGKEVTIWSTNDMRIQAGEYETDPDTGEITVKTEGSMRVDASKEMVVHGQEKNVIQSVEEMQGRAPKASGFDKHGDFDEITMT